MNFLTFDLRGIRADNREHAVANARAAAEALESDRLHYAKPREQQLVELLRLALPYVQDSRQGRGDRALEKLMLEEIDRV